MGFFRPTPKEKGIKGTIGAESEAVIAAALIQAGYTVLTPNGYMHVKNTENCLRLIPTGNNQEKNVRWAADYEL